MDHYNANAQTINASLALTSRLVVHAGYTRLREASALLGVQSLEPADLHGGSVTDATTAGFDLALPHGFGISGSSTLARTRAGGGQITTDDLTGVSAELAVVKSGLLGRHDQLRLAIASPLHTVGGRLSYSSVGVIDRETGEIGIVNQSLAPAAGSMPLMGEVMYGRRMTGLKGEFSLFGRLTRASQLVPSDTLGTMGGVQMQIGF